ncbi:P-loop NTPase fold protein [Porphyromonas sp.]|uniref:P-loop NTPase fold protein n=1 Tax=Porphyromonas sp. TaxID=1924944 RepID=UPI0026DD3860|nr:P-loop NTPase fold protein [Porphyromonas sp.]MDO4770833.1 P-loop NTPase fold protein [Porphyromonas sp.]
MNENIFNYLVEYANTPNPRYAIFLNGEWGVGKTYFIKQWIETSYSRHRSEDENTINLCPIYISLYGLSKIDEIGKAIDRELNPFLYSKAAKLLKGGAKILGKLILKTDIDLNSDGNNDATLTASLDSLSIFKSENDEVIKGVRLIVFDDIERCQISMEETLGFVNYFVEHYRCHVIILGDYNQLKKKAQSTFDDFKEKTIGREFKLEPNIDGALDFFLEEVPKCDYLIKKREQIRACFKSTGSKNLRILRRCLNDFKRQISSIKVEVTNPYLENFLFTYIAVCIDLNNKKYRNILMDWERAMSEALPRRIRDKNDEMLSIINEIEGKYKEIDKGCIYSTFYPEFVSNITESLLTGKSIQEYIKNILQGKKEEKQRSWQEILNFRELSNEDFNNVYEELTKDLLSNQIFTPYEIGRTIGYISFFHLKQIKEITKEKIIEIKKFINEYVSKQVNLDTLYKIRTNFFQGYRYILAYEEEELNMSLLKTFNEAFEKKINSLPDLAQSILRSLSDKNIDELLSIDGKVYPDHSSTYQLKPIFEKEDAEQIFISLKRMSNQGRNKFTGFLNRHYDFTGTMPYYSKDEATLSALKARIDDEIKLTQSIERYSFQELSKTLHKVINRCKQSSN